MSARGKQKISRSSRSSKSSSSSSQLPSGFSDWTWDADGARWQRYRLDASGEYEIEYDSPANKGGSAAASSTPRSYSFFFATRAGSSTATTSGDQIGTSELRGDRGIDPLWQFSQHRADLALMIPTHIRTKDPNTDREEFGPHYKAHPAWEFKWGRVFKVLWAEPKGEGGTGGFDTDASYTQRQTANGGTDFQKVRRFIIINPQRGHCICLPIHTYSGRGVTKKGVIAEHHAIIYSDKAAVYLKGEKEKGLTKTPIKVSCSSRHRLDEESRLNYAKTYTVEYNVKVCFIGKVDKGSEWQLTTDYNIVHSPLKSSRAPSIYKGDDHATEDKNISSMPGGSSNVMGSGSVAGYSLPKPLQMFGEVQDDASEDSLGIAGGRYLAPSLEVNDDNEVKWTPETDPFKSADRDTTLPLSSKELVLSRSCSIEDLESLFSYKESNSSRSSYTDETQGAERLAELLLKDEELQDLYKVAAQKVTSERLCENFRRCLVQCSAHLKEEVARTKSAAGLRCARVLRHYSRNAAAQVALCMGKQKTIDTGADSEHILDVGNKSHFQDESDDEDEDEGEGDDDWQEAVQLEEILVSSEAFKLLKENFGLYLNPDPVKRALFRTWPVSHQRSNPLEIVYHAPWIIPSFLKSSFAGDQALKSVLTISGSGLDAQAQSCGDYIAWNWPECGLLLEAFQDLLEQTSAGVEKRNNYMVLKLNVLDKVCDKSVVSVTVTAVHSTHEKVASAVSWLCAAIRPSSYDHVTYSSVSIDAPKGASKSRTIEIQLKDLEEGFQNPSCWHPLFPHAVVAKGFPTRDRIQGKGKGLEISFSDMALLSQSLNIVEHGGGLVVEGLRSFLIPIALLPDGSVQWHFEYKRSGHCRKPRKLFEVLKQAHLIKRYRTLDIEDLVQRRCFLGWVDEVDVLIGTEAFSAKTIRWSEGDKAQGTGHLKSHGITTGTEGLGIFGVSANRTWLPVSVPSRIILQPNKDIADTLDDECDARTMVYDTGTKIAHLLPQADITLFLAHKILQRRQLNLLDGNQATSLDFASLNAKAVDILRDSLDLKMVKRGRSGNISTRYFGDIVKEIWNALDMIENALVSNEAEWSTIDKGAPKFLHGVEFRDLESMKPCMTILQAKLNKPWVHLVISEPTIPVLFCQGLGQAIVPRNPKMLCRPWISVPLGENYMVATCMTICSWLDRHNNGEGSRLSERVEWTVDPRASRDGLIYCHSTKKKSFVFHEQQLNFVKKASRNAKIYALVIGHERGGLIFGSTRWRKGCSEKLDQSSSLQIRTTSLDFCSRIHLKQPDSAIQHPPDVPEGSSDTSDETEASFGTDSYSNPLSLSSSLVSQEIKERQSIEPSYSSPIVSPERTRCHPKYITQAKSEGLRPSGSRDQSMKSAPRTLKRMKKSIQLSSARTEGKNLSK